MFFFCQKETAYQVFDLRSDNAGKALKEAVESGDKQGLHVRLNTAVDPADAHAINVKYNKKCWVINVQRSAGAKKNPKQINA